MFEINYWAWSGVLSDELCDAIILEGDKLISSDGMTGTVNGGHYTPDIRETNISFFPKYHWVEALCVHYANIANLGANWNIQLSGTQEVQYARYFPDQHYSTHTDDLVRTGNGSDGFMRKLSVCIQLSDPKDYEGGSFVIQNALGELGEATEFSPRGSIIVFPSVLYHGIMPVTKGVRHSLVCWIVGPTFR